MNYQAIMLATVAMFAIGGIWFGPVFGNLWGRMHDFDKLPKAKQDELRSKMGPFYALQFLVTFLSALVLSKLATLFPYYSLYTLALWVWIGFIVPAQASAVFFGGTKPEWMAKKIAVMVLGSLLPLLAAAAIISAIQK